MAAAWLWASPPDETLRALARDLEAGGLPPGSVPLKQSDARQVWASPDTAGGLLLKRFVVHGWEARRSPLWPSRARREYRIMEELCRLGVPTVRPIACGERREGRQVVEAWFLGRLLPDAATLIERLEAADEATRPQLLAAALEALASLHRHPFLHRDLHAANLLIDRDGVARVIDLHSVWRLPSLGLARRAEMLGRFFYSLRGVVDLDRDLPGLVADYAARMEAHTGEGLETVLPAVTRAVAAFEADYVRGRTARCLRRSTEFTHGRGAGGRVHRRRVYAVDALEGDLSALPAAVTSADDDLLGDARRSQVVRIGERVLKTFRERGPLAALRGALGHGRARSAWWAARRLTVVDIPTPEALALLERRDGSAVLVTRYEHGTTLRDRLAQGVTRTERAALARAAGWLVGRLAREGLRHNDLAPKNLYATPGTPANPRDLRHVPPPGSARLLLIDLDNLTTMSPFDPRGLSRMLGQLADLPVAPSRTDRLRFARGFERAAWRSLRPDVVEAAEEFTARRRARRVALARRS